MTEPETIIRTISPTGDEDDVDEWTVTAGLAMWRTENGPWRRSVIFYGGGWDDECLRKALVEHGYMILETIS